MDIAYYYHDIYLFIVSLETLIIWQLYRNNRMISKNKNIMILYLTIIFVVLFLGCRPVSGAFVDMTNYYTYYHTFYEGVPFVFDGSVDNIEIVKTELKDLGY